MKFYHKNPRQITNRQFDDLRRWLHELGDLSGIVHNLNSDEIVGGNQRARVFDINQCETVLTDGPHEPDEQGTVALGYVLWQGKRYGYRQVRWTEEWCEKANIVANKAGGGWDWDVLANEFEVEDLLEWGFDEAELGMAGFELEQEPPPAPEPQIDRAAAIRESWQTEVGQLWELGIHRLAIGDCTDLAVQGALMQGVVPRYGMHDPPYGINVVGLASADSGGSKPYGKIGFNGVVSVNQYAPVAGDDKPFNPSALLEFCPDCVLWGANYYADKLPPRKGWIVWDKKGREEWRDNFSDCELAWTSFPITTRIYRHVWMGMVQEGERELRYHPTQKPVALFERIIGDLFSEDGTIVDFYAGSGPTLIACERLGKPCRAIELSPDYSAVIIQRWVDATGGKPILVGCLSDQDNVEESL